MSSRWCNPQGLPQLPCPSASPPGLHPGWVGVPPTHLCPPGHPAGTSHPSQGISLITRPSMSPGGGWVSRLPCQPTSVSTASCVDHTQGKLKTHVSSGDVGMAGYSSDHMVASDPAMGPGTPRGPGRAPAALLPASPLLPPQVVKRVLAQTSSGGFCGNDGFMHLTLASLPFGGVGRCRLSPPLTPLHRAWSGTFHASPGTSIRRQTPRHTAYVVFRVTVRSIRGACCGFSPRPAWRRTQGSPGVLSMPHAATCGYTRLLQALPHPLGSMMEMGGCCQLPTPPGPSSPQAGCKVLASEAGPSKPDGCMMWGHHGPSLRDLLLRGGEGPHWAPE